MSGVTTHGIVLCTRTYAIHLLLHECVYLRRPRSGPGSGGRYEYEMHLSSGPPSTASHGSPYYTTRTSCARERQACYKDEQSAGAVDRTIEVCRQVHIHPRFSCFLLAYVGSIMSYIHVSPIPIILVDDAQAKPSPSNSSRWLRVARGGLASFHPSSPTMCLHQTTLVAAPPVRNLYLAGDRSRVRHLRRRTGEGHKYRLREQGDAEHVSHLHTSSYDLVSHQVVHKPQTTPEP